MHPQYGLLHSWQPRGHEHVVFEPVFGVQQRLGCANKGGPFANEEVILLANSWIFSGLTDGEINKIMDSAKPCWYLSQVNCVVSYFMMQVVQQNVHYSDFMIFLSLQYYWDILIVNDDLPTEVPKIFIAPGSRQIRRSHQFHAFLGSDQGGIPQRRLWKKMQHTPGGNESENWCIKTRLELQLVSCIN